MKVLFLDIDGVVATRRSIETRGYKPQSAQGFDPIACELVQKLVKELDYHIVMSSTWALHGRLVMGDVLKEAGIDARFHTDWKTPRKMSSNRTHEIAMWLEEHPEVEPQNALVLDDYPCKSLTDKFPGILVIETHPDDGILWEHYETILKHNGQTPPLFLF